MHFLEYNMKKWFSITILMLWVITISETAEDRTLNLQIGFDLTQGENGVPSLRIRDFEEPQENKHRAVDAVTNEEKKLIAVRAESDSDSSESDSNDKKLKENIQNEDSSDDDSDRSDNNDSDRNAVKSTKGLRPGDYEPEDNVNIHGKIDSDSDSNNNNKRRFKRSIGKFQLLKRKGKKFKFARKPTKPGF